MLSAQSATSLTVFFTLRCCIPSLFRHCCRDCAAYPLAPTSTANTYVIQPACLQLEASSSYLANLSLCLASKFSSDGQVSSIRMTHFVSGDLMTMSGRCFVVVISVGNFSCLPRSTSMFQSLASYFNIYASTLENFLSKRT